MRYNPNASGLTARSLGNFLRKTGKMGAGDSPCYYWGIRNVGETQDLVRREEEQGEGEGGAGVSRFPLSHCPFGSRAHLGIFDILTPLSTDILETTNARTTDAVSFGPRKMILLRLMHGTLSLVEPKVRTVRNWLPRRCMAYLNLDHPFSA